MAVSYSIAMLLSDFYPDLIAAGTTILATDISEPMLACTRKKILSRVRSILRPGGYLFLGAAETTMNLDDNWQRVPFERASLYQAG